MEDFYYGTEQLDWLKKHKIAKCQPYALNYPA